MPRILGAHGLIPVPADPDSTTAAVRMDDLVSAVTKRTQGMLVARSDDMSPAIRFATERGLLLIEDSAPAFSGMGFRR